MFCNGFPESLSIQPRVFLGDGFMQPASFTHTLGVLREAAITQAKEISTVKCSLFTAGEPPIGSAASVVVVEPEFRRSLDKSIRSAWSTEMGHQFSSMVQVPLRKPALSSAEGEEGGVTTDSEEDEKSVDDPRRGDEFMLDVPLLPASARSLATPSTPETVSGDGVLIAAEGHDASIGESAAAAGLLPASSTATDFVSTAIHAVRFPEPSGLLLPGTDVSAFEFTGTHKGDSSVMIDQGDVSHPEVVRRLQRHRAITTDEAASKVPETAEEVEERRQRQNAMDVDDQQLFNNTARSVPSTMLSNIYNSISRDDRGRMVTEGSMNRVRFRTTAAAVASTTTSGDGPKVHIDGEGEQELNMFVKEMHGGQDVAVEDQAAVRVRSGLGRTNRQQRQKLNDLQRARLPPEMRKVFDEAMMALHRGRNAERARNHRDVLRSTLNNQGIAHAWQARSPKMTPHGAKAQLPRIDAST